MDSGMDIAKLVSLIMENPELIEKIKTLGEKNALEEDGDSRDEKPSEAIPTSANAASTEDSGIRSRKKLRGSLLSSLKPYVSEKRRSAIDTMMTVFDVIDLIGNK